MHEPDVVRHCYVRRNTQPKRTCKISHKGREEQGDLLMPLLFALGLHGALSGEGHVCVICAPQRVLDIYKILGKEIFAHTPIRMHHGKTQVWNRVSVIPQERETLTRVAELTRGAVVWRGDDGLPFSEQGIKILGIPVGQPVRSAVSGEVKRAPHSLPTHHHPQAGCLLLFMCATTKANCWLRGVQPEWTSTFAETHDARNLNSHGRRSAGVTASLPFFWGEEGERWGLSAPPGSEKEPIGPVGQIA